MKLLQILDNSKQVRHNNALLNMSRKTCFIKACNRYKAHLPSIKSSKILFDNPYPHNWDGRHKHFNDRCLRVSLCHEIEKQTFPYCPYSGHPFFLWAKGNVQWTDPYCRRVCSEQFTTVNEKMDVHYNDCREKFIF